MSLSIITTVLNNEEFIQDCVKSVKNQKRYKNYEHIIVDGGSKDNTIQILKRLKKNNKYLKIFKKKNFGIYQSINYGIKKSRYNHVALLHSDDFFKNDNVFVNIMNNFKSNPNLLSVHSNVEIVKRNNKKKIIRLFKSQTLKSEDFYKCLHPPHTSLFIKKKVFYKFGFYNTKFKIASDFELMLRVFGINKVYSKYINKTFVVMRSGGTSTKNILNILRSNFEVYKSFKINNIKVNIIFIFRKIITKFLQLRIIWNLLTKNNMYNKEIFIN